MDEIREETNSAEAIRQEIKEKKRTYWRGAITGAASVMAVLLIVLLIGIYRCCGNWWKRWNRRQPDGNSIRW